MPLKLDIKNFGPITSGSFELKPLTIFIGPNNAGKSYAAMLIHGISNTLRSPRNQWMSSTISKRLEQSRLLESSLDALVDISWKDGPELSPPEKLRDDLRAFIVDIYEERLGKEVSRLFTSPIRDLRRIDSRLSSLNLSLGAHRVSLSHHSKGFELKSLCQPSFEVDEESLTSFSRDAKETIRSWTLLYTMMEDWWAEVSEHVPPSNYLPAARSGILQGHKALAAGFIERAPFVGLEKRLEIPRLSGVVSDFISSILTLEDKPGPLYQLTVNTEQRLLRGNIVIPTANEHLYPEIQYQFRGTNIPLHRASSTVSELAPLFLYTKYKRWSRAVC